MLGRRWRPPYSTPSILEDDELLLSSLTDDLEANQRPRLKRKGRRSPLQLIAKGARRIARVFRRSATVTEERPATLAQALHQSEPPATEEQEESDRQISLRSLRFGSIDFRKSEFLHFLRCPNGRGGQRAASISSRRQTGSGNAGPGTILHVTRN